MVGRAGMVWAGVVCGSSAAAYHPVHRLEMEKNAGQLGRLLPCMPCPQGVPRLLLMAAAMER